MKKLISIITVFVLMSVTVFASDAEDLAALFDKSGDLRSASVEMTLKTDLNKPLDIIGRITDSESGYSDINPQMMAESLIGTEMKINCTYSVSENYNKMLAEMYMEFDAPIRFNENLKINAWTKIGMWFEYDMTDKENPVYRTIIKNPIEKKYYVTDMSGYFKENPEELPEINAATIKEQQKKAKEALLNNAEITKANGIYTIKFTDETAKGYITDIMSQAKEFMPAAAEADNIISQLTDFFGRVSIFGRDGITITVSQNDKGYIDAETADIHINMNVYDAIMEFGGNTEELDRDKANIDLTVKAECAYKDHNAAQPVIPEITDDNSYISVSDYHEYDDNGIMLWSDHDGEEPAYWKDNTVYFPYEDMARQIGLDLKTEVNGDTITISSGGGYHVDVKGNEVTLYGDTELMELEPVIEENGRRYCTIYFLGYLGMDSWDSEYDIASNSIKYEFYYFGLPEDPSNDTETYTDPDFEEYNPFKDKRYYYVNSDRALYLANDTAYVPIYDLLNEISVGEYTFINNGFEYRALWENALGIDTVSVYPGNKFVTVNGEKTELPYEAVDIDGVMRVPVAFAEKIGLEIDSIRLSSYITDTTFSFVRQDADEPDSYDYDYYDYGYNNWFNRLVDPF